MVKKSLISAGIFLPADNEYIINPKIKLPKTLTHKVPTGNEAVKLFRYLDKRNLDIEPIKPPMPMYIIVNNIKLLSI
jgi:hypothetical protein